MPAIPALRLRQEDYKFKFETSLDYIKILSQKINK
jgi:hypothetical protein